MRSVSGTLTARATSITRRSGTRRRSTVPRPLNQRLNSESWFRRPLRPARSPGVICAPRQAPKTCPTLTASLLSCRPSCRITLLQSGILGQVSQCFRRSTDTSWEVATVIDFHMLQRLVSAACRRLLALLSSFYDDDATLQIIVQQRRGQRHLRGFFRLLGRPLSAAEAVGLFPKRTAWASSTLSRRPLLMSRRLPAQGQAAQKVSDVHSALGRTRWVSPPDASKPLGISQFWPRTPTADSPAGA